MGVYKLSASGGLKTGRTTYASMLAGNPVFLDPAMELITSTVLSGNQSSITFDVSALASTYRHLQIRTVARDQTAATGTSGIWLQMNSDTANNYVWHRVKSGGGSVISEAVTSTNRILAGLGCRNSDTANVYGPAIIDIADFASTVRNKTIKGLAGNLSTTSSYSEVDIHSGAWLSTSPITSLTISGDGGFVSGSRFSIYGIRG